MPTTQPILIAVRNMRLIASNMRQSDDYVVAQDSYALEDLADALERSLTTA